jgi:glycosyltransferase involved in cell wall biosynthesis
VRVALIAPLVTPIREPQLGGSQAFLAELAGGLARRGHEVEVYAASGSRVAGAEVIDLGIDHRALAATLYRDADADDGEHARGAAEAAFARVYDALRTHGCDVVHNHAFDAPAIDLASGLGAPVAHTLHLPPRPAVAAAVRRAAAGDPRAALVCVSAWQARAWAEVAPVDAILPPYVPTASIPFAPGPGAGVVFAGRLSPEKGAAEAIVIARAAGLAIDVFGDPYDADYARREIEPRRRDPGVRVHSAVSRRLLWEAMGRATVVLCPARWEEPFGMVAAEAQACGTPVVAFRRGALEEVIADGVTGLLVEPDDLDAAAAAVPAAAALSRADCREHAERRLDLELSLDAHERLYVQLAGAGSRAAVGG